MIYSEKRTVIIYHGIDHFNEHAHPDSRAVSVSASPGHSLNAVLCLSLISHVFWGQPEGKETRGKTKSVSGEITKTALKSLRAGGEG